MSRCIKCGKACNSKYCSKHDPEQKHLVSEDNKKEKKDVKRS